METSELPTGKMRQAESAIKRTHDTAMAMRRLASDLEHAIKQWSADNKNTVALTSINSILDAIIELGQRPKTGKAPSIN
jgi:hypothetical protein